ncbi:molybdenum cofactor biosynthesis protein MoaE [Enterobacter hormaechei]
MLTLEHYPGMTEKSLAAIVEEARGRWPLGRVTVIHRIGEMWPGEELCLSASPAPIAGVRFAAGSSSWIILKPKRRSGNAKRRRKVSAGWITRQR